MNVDLGKWQARLFRHFTELRQFRSSKAVDRPIFALEHGLDHAEVEALAETIREHAATDSPSPDHALPWIVYAAEVGYRYSGDEYWQTFESETPGWSEHGDRYWIRTCYYVFHATFNGAKPSGRWADHFSIICWPITHAILPLDLQRQLARILYDLRHSFSAELFESPSRLGEFIAAAADKSWNTTSRFKNLAQQTLLLGQIAAALLLRGELNTESLIHPATLRRISGDLDRERRTRDWLRGAQRVARERAHIRGLGFGWGSTSPIPHRADEARAEIVALGIEPRLVLQPNDSSATSWEVLLEVPDLSHLFLKFPSTREILSCSRCSIAGSRGAPRARGWTLHGSQRVVLVRWPRADEVLLKFDKSDPQLDYLLSTECLLRPGPTWLFRIASDGLAYECRGLRVRPGEKYILIKGAGSLRLLPQLRPINIACEGVKAVILDLPAALTPHWEETISSLGLGQAKTIEVWPAGLAALTWDGEGHGEWLASERPCLAIRTDHPVDSIIVSMEARNESPLEIAPVVPGEPVFVELPTLPVGLHTVQISTRGGPETELEALGVLDVMMRIRGSRTWSPGIGPNGPLLVHIEPTSPTLEQLWEELVEVSLCGPFGRNVSCRVTFFEKEGDSALFSKQLTPLKLPVSPHDWRSLFEKHCRQARDVQAVYDAAITCELDFNAEELGAFTLRCERESTPLRWMVRRRGKNCVLRLLDDTGRPDAPILTRLAFETPSLEETLSLAPDYSPSSEGGLYVARMGEFTASIIVPPMGRGLADLGCSPRIEVQVHTVEGVLRTIALARLWGKARLPGDVFSVIRRGIVLREITYNIFRLLGGQKWANAEIAARTKGIPELKEAMARGKEEEMMGKAIAYDCLPLSGATCSERVRYLASLGKKFLSLPPAHKNGESVNMVRRRKLDTFTWISELALRLASDPVAVEEWAGQDLSAGIIRLFELPALARTARFLVLAINAHLKSVTSASEIYAGWRWT
ncbi:MAG: hypothetical protein C4576_30675 [Desulfobacteraceae bacterium]|nr:MAG: hypothetical protein C4576_30675 [Desulfobacteraceae bacterium]